MVCTVGWLPVAKCILLGEVSCGVYCWIVTSGGGGRGGGGHVVCVGSLPVEKCYWGERHEVC